jgi:1,4-alpha-glucan branching enzyme
MSWLDRYHIDGLRVDAVASMIYLDYSRKEGEWTPNVFGGRENLEALSFLRQLNTAIYARFPDVQTFAEESTAWPMVSRPVSMGGLGFGLKWDMGWMHDTLKYMQEDPVHRRFHHNQITFRALYAFTENYVLPLSHDEVVHGKRSLIAQMPGDDWQRFANLRLLFGYMYAQPGKKLLFMGDEFAQWGEWQHENGLDWGLTRYDRHEGMQRLVGDLNRLYQAEPALHVLDCDGAGFEWIDGGDAENSVLTFLRKGPAGVSPVLIACNFTPVPRQGYRIGVPTKGTWRLLLSTDAAEYWGSGIAPGEVCVSEAVSWHGRPHSIEVTLPPLSTVFFKLEAGV